MTVESLPQLPTQLTPIATKDKQTGNYTITTPWHNFHTQLTQYLQTNLNQEGYQLPLINNAQLAILQEAKNIGRVVYNTDTNQVYVGVPS